MLQILKKLRKIVRHLQASKFENLDIIDKSLGNNTTFKKLVQGEIEDLSSPIIFKEIESVVKIFALRKKISGPIQLQKQVIPTFKEWVSSNNT